MHYPAMSTCRFLVGTPPVHGPPEYNKGSTGTIRKAFMLLLHCSPITTTNKNRSTEISNYQVLVVSNILEFN